MRKSGYDPRGLVCLSLGDPRGLVHILGAWCQFVTGASYILRLFIVNDFPDEGSF